MLNNGGVIIARKYSDRFKLSVIKDYYSSPLGVRAIAAKYD
jgi:transposase-like protein